MPRRRRFVVPVLLALAATACAENTISLSIQQNQQRQPGGMVGMCLTTADPVSLAISEGTLDLALRDTYVMFPLYRNELLAYRDPTANRPETRGIVVEDAEVTLVVDDAAQTPVVPRAFTVRTNTFVRPGDMSGPGYGVGSLEVIPAIVGRALRARVCAGGGAGVCPSSQAIRLIARVRPFGRTMGGLELTGAEFQYPINVCCRCLVSFPADADDPMVPEQTCSRGMSSTMTCDIGQDTPVDCRACALNNPLCRPTCGAQ